MHGTAVSPRAAGPLADSELGQLHRFYFRASDCTDFKSATQKLPASKLVAGQQNDAWICLDCDFRSCGSKLATVPGIPVNGRQLQWRLWQTSPEHRVRRWGIQNRCESWSKTSRRKSVSCCIGISYHLHPEYLNTAFSACERIWLLQRFVASVV